MNWFAAQTLMETARDKSEGKPIANNTRLYFETALSDNIAYPRYIIRLHGNVIMQIYRDKIVPLDGGWRTVTTKERLNRYLPRGYKVYQKDWEWYLEVRDSIKVEPKTYPFDDVHWIHNDGRVMLYNTHPNYPNEEIKRTLVMKDILNKYKGE